MTPKIVLPFFLPLVLSVTAALAQQNQTASETQNSVPQPGVKAENESVTVTGTFIPAPLSENDRSVQSLDTRQDSLLFGSTPDYLRADPTVDLRARAPFGVQADLSILGSTFAETLVLLNGLRLNDAQSSHHDMDIPVPLDAVSSIEILHGSGSTFYGTDAMGGAVNFITGPPKASELRLRAGAGSDGFNQEHVLASLLRENWSE